MIRKNSKAPISKIQRKLWEHCRRIVRERYPHECYTCPKKNLEGKDLHTGHGPWPKSTLGAFLKYDLRVLRLQCYDCNVNKGGMGAEFYKRMLAEVGAEAMAQLEKDRQKLVKAYDHYVQILAEYEAM